MESSGGPEETRTKKPISRQLFFSLLLLSILLITVFSFVISPAFSIGTVLVTGNSYLTDEEVFALADIPERVNTFRLNGAEIEARLSKDLRIEAARVTRSFPGTLTIEVAERRPAAYVACDYGFVEVDRSGIVLAAYKTVKNIRAPMVTGITLHNLYVGDRVAEPALLEVLTYLAALSETALNQMSEVNISDRDHMVAYTNAAVQIRIGGADRLPEKAKLTQGFLEDAEIKKMSVEYIDFNFASPFMKVKK